MAAAMPSAAAACRSARSKMAEPTALVVFKTMSDPFAGRISFFKVVSGVREERRDARELHATRPGALLAPERDAGPQGR